MKRARTTLEYLTVLLGPIVVGALAAELPAQTSSLYRRDLPVGNGGPMTLEQGSWFYRKLPPPHEIRDHDVVSIRVDEKSQTFSEGEVQRRKNALYDAVLKDWVHLDGLRAIKPDKQADGDQHIQGTLNQLYRAEADLETRESVKFDIAAHVVDIRPNGNLVLEAHRVIRNNDEVWEYSLTGVCRRQDIGPDNVLLSQNIAELSVLKRERGHIRDSYRRGWVLKLMDLFQWF